MSFPSITAIGSSPEISHADFDLSIVVSEACESSDFPQINELLLEAQRSDPRVGRKPSLVAAEACPGARCLLVPTGPLNRDYDDVRRFFDIGKSIASLLLDLDSIKPLLSVNKHAIPSLNESAYQHALENIYLGICQGLWQPLEARQSLGESVIEPVQAIGILGLSKDAASELEALEAGKRLARDLCGTEPERMAPIGFAQYCEEAFANTGVKLEILSDPALMLKDYPCLHAVARASFDVARHHPRIINMEYDGGDATKTIFLAGKGITYDTGGADLKVNGHMAGMSRDKGGAAAVAGIMKSLSLLKPKGIKVVASIAAVRNSIGADAYVPDEIITTHAGVRVRVGNTDAEGRMVMCDILSHMREQAQHSVAPQLFSLATLTGHAAIAFGPYTALLENQEAINQGVSQSLIAAGHLWSDPCEQSRVRREDYDFIQPRTKSDDVLSSNNAASVGTVRGHQFPMAFLSIASGLDKHQQDSSHPIAYTHVDIAGSAVEGLDWQHGKPTAAPVAAFVKSLL